MSAALKHATQLKIQMSVVTGPHAGQTFNFTKSSLTLGRGPENDVVLVNDPLVSRMHARIEFNSDSQFELINLSQKNGLLVQGEYVDKWRLVNDSIFQVGESEIKFQFDFGQAVVSVPPQPRPGPVLSIAKPESTNAPVVRSPPPKAASSLKNSSLEPIRPAANKVPSLHQTQTPQAFNQNQQVKSPHPFAQTGFSQPNKARAEEEKNKKIRFFAIAAIIIFGAIYFVTNQGIKARAKKAKAVLKYEDEIQFNQKSEKEVDLRKKLDEEKKVKDSPTNQRAEENFIKGMRDFQLGNYARAQDFFQVVLNLIPDHALARRHLYLSKVRFDELVQAKLMLGESYYQKHNFSMCQSMYQQVMDMLQGKSSDQKYQLAQKMLEKCQLASEGIR